MSTPPRTPCLILILLVVACGRTEPTYGSRKASDWAREITGPTRGSALLAKGADAVPILVEIATGRYGKAPAKRAHTILLELDAIAIPALVRVLESGDTLNRTASLRVLGEHGLRDEAATVAIRKMLADPDRTLRSTAAWNLYRWTGEAEAVLPVLVADLERGDPFAAEWIIMIGADAAPYTIRVTALIENEDPVQSASAVRVLRAIGPGAAAALPMLLRYVEGPVPDRVELCDHTLPAEVGDAALASVARRSGQREAAAALVGIDPANEVGEDLLRWFLEHGNSMEVADAAGALWEAGPRRAEAEAALRKLVAQRSTAHDAAAVLGRIGPDAAWAVPRYVALLDDREMHDGLRIGWGSHMDFARALGRMGPAAEAALPRLRAAMTDHHLRVRPVAALAVFRIGGDAEKVIPALLAVIEADLDAGYWAAKDAVRALGEIASTRPAARAALEGLTTHPRFAVRSAARAVLNGLR